MGVNEFLEDSSVLENTYKFINDLPDDYQEKD